MWGRFVTKGMAKLFILAALIMTIQGAGMTRSAAQEEGVVFITGASRGIGLEVAREYASHGWTVIATCRTPATAEDLKELAASNSKVSIEQLDVVDDASIAALAEKLEGTAIDVLINNAGISGGRDTQTFGELQYEAFAQVMDVNVLGPLKVTEAFFDNVLAGEQKKLITISSTQGSISRSFGTQVFYRASKAAINMIMYSLSKDLKNTGVTFALVTPGFVRTDFTAGIDLPIMINVDESAAGIYKTISGLTFEQSGIYIRHSGEVVPW